MFGALLSAAALAVSMPLTAFAGSTDTVERIQTTGWVQVSNATPQKGDVISMSISLSSSTGMKGISGWMRTVDGAVPCLGPESTAAPSVSAVPTATPTPSAAPTQTIPVEPSQAPSASASETPNAGPSEAPGEAETTKPDAEQSTEPTNTSDSSSEASEPAVEDPSASADDETRDPEASDNTESPALSTEEEPSDTSSSEPENSDDTNDKEPDGDDTGSETPDTGTSEENGSEDMLSRDPDKGWMGLLSEDDLFIVLSADQDLNSAKRYFQITGEPGSTVKFEFTGRYSDGNGDHVFIATHEFQVAQTDSKTTNRISVNSGSVRTVDGSSLKFRVWPSSDLTTIEGVRASSAVQTGTSPGELLRNLRLPANTTARVYRADTSVPRLSGICTGDTVRFRSTARGADSEAVAVVRGDLLGTGKLGLNQLVAMAKTLAGQVPLDEANLQAADVNSDGKVTPADATALKKLVLARK